MRRFMVNRWWTLCLALVLSLAGVLAVPSVGRSDGGGANVGGEGSGGGGTIDPSGAGDPDIPINTGKGSTKPTARLGRANVYAGPRGTGDATAAQIVWVYKYRIALQMFRVFVLRF